MGLKKELKKMVKQGLSDDKKPNTNYKKLVKKNEKTYDLVKKIAKFSF